jgi:hypothetical protein
VVITKKRTVTSRLKLRNRRELSSEPRSCGLWTNTFPPVVPHLAPAPAQTRFSEAQHNQQKERDAHETVIGSIEASDVHEAILDRLIER